MKIGLVQRVLAGYRVPFFDLLAERFDGQLSIFSGDPRPEEMIDTSAVPEIAKTWHAENWHFLNGRHYLCFQKNILSWLNEWNPDALVVEANLRYPLTWQAIYWLRRRNRPLIGWGLGSGSVKNPLKNSFLRQFDALITYSQAGAESYHATGIPKAKIFIAKNAVTRRPVQSAPPERPDQYPNHPSVLFTGRLQERKRVDLLMQACAQLDESLKPVLWIVGDGPERQRLAEIAVEVYPKTLFFGALFGEDLTSKFEKADLFVLPGTGGLALQQAMASGLPVIAAEADGTQQDLVRPENGIIVPPGDLEALTQAISGLLSDPKKLRSMGKASFEIVRNEINLENMTSTFVQAIQYAADSRAKR